MPSYVVAVDGSKYSLASAKMCALAAQKDDHIHIYSCFVRASFLESAEPQQKASEHLNETVKAYFKDCANVTTTVEQVQDPRKAICDFAEAKLANVVVMGTRGLNMLQRILVGSVSNYVLHHARDAALVVHGWEPKSEQSGLSYMVCVDGSAHSQRAADRVAKMVKKGDSVTIFTFYQLPPKVLETALLDPEAVVVPSAMENPNFENEKSEVEQKAHTLCKAVLHNFTAATSDNPNVDGVKTFETVEGGFDPREAILNKAKELNADVIVLGCRGESDVARMVFGSVSSHIIHHAEGRGVMVVH